MSQIIKKQGEIYCTQKQFDKLKQNNKLIPGTVYCISDSADVYVEYTDKFVSTQVNNYIVRIYPTITVQQFNAIFEALKSGKVALLRWKVMSATNVEVSGTSTVLHYLDFSANDKIDRRMVLIANGISIEYDYLKDLNTNEETITEHFSVGSANEVYPVGSIYITVDTMFNPAEKFGGAWARVESGRALATSDGTDVTSQPNNPWAANARGGSYAYTLSMNANDLPSHQHIVAVRSEEGIYTAMEGEYLGGSQDVITSGVRYNGATTGFTGANDIATFNIDTVSPYVALNVWWRVS